jgi:hypothetical protein
MYRLILVYLVLAFSFPLFAARSDDEELSGDVPPSAETELYAALRHKYSGRFEAEDLNHIYYFTTYAIPEKWNLNGEEVQLRQQADYALSFVLNSCASHKSEGHIEKPRRVNGSKTLWWVDIRDYGWSTEDMNTIFRIQPYFLAPLVTSKENAIIFRADWFIVNAMDSTKQEDRGIKDIAYFILLYGKGNEPKNAEEFRKRWNVDLRTIRAQKLETGTIVDSGESGVSQHTRQLRRGRTITGYYWETRDVKSHDADRDKVKARDFVEEISAEQFDAGEYIVSHKNGLQVYLLSAGVNEDFKVVNFADPTLVVDRQDRHDPRVRTAKGCIICHSMGIIPYTNTVRDLFRSGIDLKVKNKDLARALKAFYLKHDGSEVEDDNRIYERAVKQVNGLDPQSNAKAYQLVYDWYWNNKVTLEQAAREWGMETEMFRQQIKGTTGGRLSLLYKNKPMPREIWDAVQTGGYIQSGLLIRRIASPFSVPTVSVPLAEVVTKTNLIDGKKVLAELDPGAKVEILKTYDDEWFYARSGSVEGYILRANVKELK